MPFPPDKGDRIRSYNILKFLARRHALSLMAVSHDPVDPASAAALGKICASVEIFKIDSRLGKLRSGLGLLTGQPLTLPAFYSRSFDRSVQKKLAGGKLDLVYIYSSPMAQYVLGAAVPKLMDFIDVDSQKWLDYAGRSPQPMKAIYAREGKRLRDFEREAASICERSVVTSDRELKLLREIAPGARSSALPNGVDFGFKNGRPYRPNRLVFVGSMDYFPNVDAMAYFVRDILPLIQKEIPDVELAIVGRNPPRRIKALGRLKNVTVTGYVEEVGPYLADAAASVIPLRIARGIQTKLLEAMAHGVPVIGTSAALDGIDATPGRDVLAGDSPESFARQTVAVLKDRRLRADLAARALELVQREYNWETRLRGLDAILTSMVGGT